MSPKQLYQTFTNKKTTLKNCQDNNFLKTLLQSFSIFFKIVHPCLLLYFLCYLYLLFTFHAVIFNISLSLVAVSTVFEFDKIQETAPSIKYSKFHFNSLQSDRILYNLLTMLITDILDICIPLQKLKRKEKESHELSYNLIVLFTPIEGNPGQCWILDSGF